LIYLASPYSDDDPAVREQRFQQVCEYAAECLRDGIHVFSPIAHAHSIYGLPSDWQFWQDYDREWIQICSELWVLKLPGWKDSLGVMEEILFARKLGKQVTHREWKP